MVASYGDKVRLLGREGRSRLLIYPLSLAIYCTSWTFFGSVGLASRNNGYDFLAIYVGPVLMIALAWPLVVRVVRLAKSQNITSIADFIAARYGKHQGVAAIVALIAIVGTVPYIALQLKAVSSSLATILGPLTAAPEIIQPVFGDISLFVALAMASFAVLFGTRHIDATEHQHGLMLAVAAESLVKLIAFLAVGIFVTFVMFDGPADLLARALKHPATAAVLTGGPQLGTFAVMTLLALSAILLVPRQFHVAVVENNNEDEIRRASWLFPIYLVLINLFVMPIAIAGLLTFEPGRDGDMYVLALPLSAGSHVMAIVAFVGGLSAATAMVIVESVALAIMVSNDLVVPMVLKRREDYVTGHGDVGTLLLASRRVAIFAILLLAYLYYRSAGDAQLASIGLLSFAAVAQLAPAFFGGLIWRRATARGAIAGMSIGILAWAYTLLLPSFADAGLVASGILAHGPFGLVMLRPHALLGLDLPPLVHGAMWSLALNVLAYIGFSLARAPAAIERLQADLFVPPDLKPMAPSFLLRRSPATVAELTTTVARYLGEERTRASFDEFAATHRISLAPEARADFQLLRHAEHLIASAIGAASSRLVLSLLLRRSTVSTEAALRMLDDASAAFQYNREILQTALDHVRQGIAVLDKDMHLVCWNRQFGEVLGLPHELVRIGIGLDEILRFNAEKGAFGAGEVEALVAGRIAGYVGREPFLERFPDRGLVIEIRANRMPGGGIVTTFTDITPSVEAAEALERRVDERTYELKLLNDELVRAKAAADEANISKTRFLAAASHDILQPLNAARLYVTSLVERQGSGETAGLAGNVDASLEAVEEIIGALLDISRLDTGSFKPEIASFRIDELLRQLEVEFAPLAREKGLDLVFVPSSLTVRSDRRLLRRLLQNLVSNAVKYTPSGRVLVGSRRRGARVRIDVYDTGIGIPKSKQRIVFTEFHRLEQGARVARGLGLGLSIVERIARVLDHRVWLESVVEHGSRFSVEIPLAPAAVKPRRRDEPRTTDMRRLTGMAVLCIDNDAKILDGMNALLGGWGCRVIAATDLNAATAALRDETAAACRPAGRLSPRPWRRHRGDRRVAPRPWRRPACDPAHRRPHRRRARGRARAGHSSAEQADQAGGIASPADTMAHPKGGGGGVTAVAARSGISDIARITGATAPAATARPRSWRPRSPPGCGSRPRVSAGSPRHAP